MEEPIRMMVDKSRDVVYVLKVEKSGTARPECHSGVGQHLQFLARACAKMYFLRSGHSQGFVQVIVYHSVHED